MKAFLILATTLILCFGVVNADGITVSNFDGGWDNDIKVTTGEPVTWTLHWNTYPGGLMSFTNGFKVYISDQPEGFNVLNPGPGFSPIIYEVLIQDFDFDCVSFVINYFGIDGIGADTVGFGAVDCWPLISVDEDVYTITTQVENNAEGKYLCLDSSFYPPGGAWLWARDYPYGSHIPPWDGPHCYLIKECCQGIRGDVTGAEGILIDDLMYLRDYLFIGGPPPDCLEKGDVVIDGNILVNDLVFLVDYLFKGGDAPPPCD